MNPNDIFWLARYAHNVVSPLLREGERLQLVLDMGGRFPKVQAWVFPSGDGAIVAHDTNLGSKEEVDKFVATLRPLEAGIAA